MKGKIKWYKREKGYGFIVGDDGKDYFVHYTALPQDMEDAREDQGIEVTFELKDTDRGPQAVDIVFVEESDESGDSEDSSEE